MTRRVITAREQLEMLSPWHRQASAADYKRRHRPPGPNCGYPLHEMDVSDDFYDHPEWYNGDHSDSVGDMRAVQNTYRQAKGDPNLPVTVHRAMPLGQDEINEGDWVTLSPGYAQGHINSQVNPEDFHIVSKTVPASHVWSDGGDFNELGYWPSRQNTTSATRSIGDQ